MKRYAALVAIVAIVALAPLVVRYPELETQILTFGLLAVSFTLLMGEMGFLSFGQATFNGVGAYAVARLLIDAHLTLPLALVAAVALSALVAAAIGALSIVGRGVYGVMLTFAFNEMAYYVAFEWRGVTGGDNGLRGLPAPDLFGIPLASATAYYYFVAVVVLLAFGAVLLLSASPFGAVLRAIRENEDRARAIGYRVRRFKITAFAISGALAGLAGGLYSELFRFVPLHAIDIETSTDVVIAALLGGTGSPFGALLGAAIFTVLSSSLSHVWSHWPLLFGIVFCAVVLFLRGGLWSVVERWRPRAAHA